MPSEDPSSLPAHGRVVCARCFCGSAVWNETERIEDGWHIVNNPMSWGATAPRFLLLGVSKGTTQVDAIAAKPHDDVPFAGFRPALTRALQTLGLMGAGDSVDAKISAGEPDWAFGSMVRCALGLPKGDEIERSGTVVQQIARMPVSESWITRCASAFLGALPTRLSVVVLLSNGDRYVETCFAAIRRLRPRTKRINDVAYSDGSITWVHIIHVGGPGKNHVAAWFEGEGKQGAKRRAAQAAVQQALGTAAVSVTGGAPKAITLPTPPKEPAPMPTTEPRTPGAARPGPYNPTRDAILLTMAAHPSFSAHPGETMKGETKYVAAFRACNGRAVAFDKGVATKQPVWIVDEPPVRALLARLRVAFDDYPPEKGRNSNLSKISEFEARHLLRAFPESKAEAVEIVEAIASL